jgi:malate permease and related proteins
MAAESGCIGASRLPPSAPAARVCYDRSRVITLLSIFAHDVLPVFVVASVGFAIARIFKTDVRTLSRVAFNALSPCLVFHQLVRSSVSADDFIRMTVFTVAVVLAVGALGWLLTRPFRLGRAATSAFLIVVMFSNSGNYGLPVVLFAFGPVALAHATVYFVANAVATYTLGVFLASAGRRSAGRAIAGVLRVPAVWGVVAAGVVLGLGLSLDQPVMSAIMRPVELLSGAAIPVMILVLGMQLERGAWPERPGLVALAVGLSLVVTPLLAFGACGLLGIAGPARQAAIVQSAMPSAVLTTILALEFDVAPSFVTACVLVSTLLSPVTVTLIISWLS